MSLEIFPTYPKIRAEQLDQVYWPAVNSLISLINTGDSNAISTAVAQALAFGNLDPAVANALGTANSQSSNAVKNIITADYLDPLVANRINTSGTQTRTAIDNLLASAGIPLGGTLNIGSVNWNTLTQTKAYLGLGTGTGGTSVPPWPNSENAIVLVLAAGGRVAQILMGPNSTAFREYNGTSWTLWFFRTLRIARTTLASNTTLSTSSSSPTSLISITPSAHLSLLATPTMVSRLVVSVNIAIGASSITPAGTTGIRIKVGTSVIFAQPLQSAGDLFTYPNSTAFTIAIPYTDTPTTAIALEAYDTRTSGIQALATWWGATATQMAVMFA